MKKRNKTLLAICVILLLLTLLVDFSFTTISDTANVTKDDYAPWNDDLEKKLNGIEINTLNFTSNTTKWALVQDSSPNSTKKYKNDTVRNESNINVRFVLDDFHVGFGRFIPLYKHVGYDSKIIYEWSANVSKNETKSFLKNKGQFEIDGHANISGICSASKAKKIIEDIIHKKVKDEIQREIDNQITIVQ